MASSPLNIPWLFFVFFYSFLLNHVVVSSGSQCLAHQQSLLLQLKNTLIFDATTSKSLVRWNQSSDCCSWEGISCEQGHVTSLKLSNESISGGINDSSTLFNLQYLRSLDLSYNCIKSTIPSRIGNLINLSYLNFSNVFLGQIPKEISHLKQLLILDLSRVIYLDYLPLYDFDYYLPPYAFYFYGFWLRLESPNLRTLVQNLTKLEELYLDRVNILAPGNEWGRALSSSLPNLRVLSLHDCGLSGPIHHSLAKLRYLSVIRLGDNNLSFPVPRFFVDFSNLTSLNLISSGLYGRFPNEIFHIPTLRVLDISFNELLEGSLPEFHPSSDIQFLAIRSTNFKGRLPSSIGNLRQLTHLYLSDCFFGGPLPKSIAKLTQLVHLDLSYNQFVGPIPSFDMTKNLEAIALSSNHLSGPLPKSIAKLTQLVHLDLSYNQFVGPIPSFDMTKNLEAIALSSNHLSGPISSSHLGGLLNLWYIDLKNNFFNGNIPASLFTLPLLIQIDLSENQFSGQVLEFPNASSSMLERIDLSSNKLQGPIPMSIFKLRALEYLLLSSNNFNGIIPVNESGYDSNFSSRSSYLDLSNNQIYGEIPNWIWNIGVDINFSHNHFVSFQEPYSLHSLSSIDLSFNDLYGKMPNLPPYAYHIDLSSNCFTSSIPSDFGNNLTSYYLSVANNSFTGVIPESICNVSELQVLDLSDNNLYGIIPTCMFSSSSMFGVKLRRNNLNGPIPNVFPGHCNLLTLDLNGNMLSNRIPKSLANCKALEDLDLGNNQMVDTFPMFLKNIYTLRVLILKSNKFYGHIACTENIVDWPMIQIVDISSNNFSGELPGKCLKKWHAMMAVKGCGRSQLDSTALPPRNEDNVSVNALAPTLGVPPTYAMSPTYGPAPSSPPPPSSPSSSTPAPTQVQAPTGDVEDAVSVTNKGQEMEMLRKRITSNGFTSIDFSSNNFHGEIPNEFGQLISLKALNLSNNFLSAQIPSSFGKLCQLESLDLSRNHLSGKIPPSLSNLYFLGFLNLSYNQLHGRIPTGTQIQTFSADRFQGNQGLCGPPLTPNCPGDVAPDIPKANHSISGNSKNIEWNLISAEIGFIVGFGTVIGPLVFWSRWRKLYFNRVEDIAFSILPQILLRKWLSWKMGIRRN